MGNIKVNSANCLEVEVPIQTDALELVRGHFNPSSLETVDVIKAVSAALISLVQAQSEADPREKAVAVTHIQTASMFAVAAVTKNL